MQTHPQPEQKAKNKFPFEIKEKTLTELNQEPKFVEAMDPLLNKTNPNPKYLGRSIMEDQYGFTIDSTNINELSTDNYKSYTFLIYRETVDPSVFENLVVILDSTAPPKASIVKYHLNSAPVYISEDDAYAIDAQTEIIPINYNNAQARMLQMEGCVVVTLMCPWHGEHSVGEACEAANRGDLYWVYDFSGCGGGSGGGSTGGGSPEGGSPAGDSPGGGRGGGGSGDDSNPNNNPGNVNYEDPICGGCTTTVPVIPGLNEDVALRFKLQKILQFPTDSNEYNWLYNQATHDQLQNIHDFLDENGADQESQDLVNEAIDVIMAGGEFDYEEKIILDSTFVNHPRLKCVYDKFKSGTNTIAGYLNNFLPDNAVGHLNFSADKNFKVNQPTESWGAGAITDPPVNGANGSNVPGFNINIVFNTDPSLTSSAQNFPTIILAQELIHEMVHAEMYRKLLACAQLPHVNYQGYTDEQWKSFVYSLKHNYEGLYDYYERYYFNNANPSATQHNAMASHYRNMVIAALKDFDNNRHIDPFYNAIAWMGLKETEAWNDPAVNQSQINSIINNVISNETHSCHN